jgi:uncharacterized membrane protein YphA (DoxX/SURF4 family)
MKEEFDARVLCSRCPATRRWPGTAERLAPQVEIRHKLSWGESQTLKEEFHAYGLPDSMFYLVGLLKVGAGVVLVTGVWLDLPVQAAAGVVALLMVGAIAMHVKVGDPVGRSVPAALMLIMSAGIVLLA